MLNLTGISVQTFQAYRSGTKEDYGKESLSILLYLLILWEERMRWEAHMGVTQLDWSNWVERRQFSNGHQFDNLCAKQVSSYRRSPLDGSGSWEFLQRMQYMATPSVRHFNEALTFPECNIVWVLWNGMKIIVMKRKKSRGRKFNPIFN